MLASSGWEQANRAACQAVTMLQYNEFAVGGLQFATKEHGIAPTDLATAGLHARQDSLDSACIHTCWPVSHSQTQPTQIQRVVNAHGGPCAMRAAASCQTAYREPF